VERLASRKWLKVCMLLIVASMFVSACGSNKTPPVWNISGGWFMFIATKGKSGEEGPNLFTFTSTQNKITGVTDQNLSITGEITGSDISFSWVRSDGVNNAYTGTVGADGSTMSGTWAGSNGQSGTWHAVISLVPQVNIAGNFNVFQSIAGSTGEQGLGVFAFTQTLNDATKTASKIIGTTPDGRQITGAIGRLDITFFWIDSDGVTHTFTGIITADGATMSGTWSDTSGKSGTWRATKS